MAKTKATKRKAARRPDALTTATALERARLKRLVQAKRDIANLAGQLRRQTTRAEGLLVELASDIATGAGYEMRLVSTPVNTPPRADAGE